MMLPAFSPQTEAPFVGRAWGYCVRSLADAHVSLFARAGADDLIA